MDDMMILEFERGGQAPSWAKNDERVDFAKSFATPCWTGRAAALASRLALHARQARPGAAAHAA